MIWRFCLTPCQPPALLLIGCHRPVSVLLSLKSPTSLFLSAFILPFRSQNPSSLRFVRRRSISPLHPHPSHQLHCFPTTLPLCFPSSTSHPEPRPCVTHELLYCLSSELNVSYWMGSQKEICFLKTSMCVPPFSFLC